MAGLQMRIRRAMAMHPSVQGHRKGARGSSRFLACAEVMEPSISSWGSGRWWAWGGGACGLG